MTDSFSPRPTVGASPKKATHEGIDFRGMSIADICPVLEGIYPEYGAAEIAILAAKISASNAPVVESTRPIIQSTALEDVSEELPVVDMKGVVPENLASEPVQHVKPALPADSLSRHVHQPEVPVVEKTQPLVQPRGETKATLLVDEAAFAKYAPSESESEAEPSPTETENEPAPAPAANLEQSITTKLSEISTLPEDDMRMMLLEPGLLVGSNTPMDHSPEVKGFMASIQYDHQGNPLHRSQAEEERFDLTHRAISKMPPVMTNGRPAFEMALERPNVTWGQTVSLNGKDVAPVTSRAAKDRGARGALRRNRGTGSPVTLWLPSTGIYVGFRAANESDTCDFDVRLTTETSIIGMQTYGLLLSASSGVYMRHMIEHALNFVTDTTYDCAGNDLKTTLLNVVDVDDYWLLILGPVIAQYPSGLPWHMVCPSDPCGHGYDVALSLSRCIRMADGLFTDRQRKLWVHQRGANPTLSHKQYMEYRQDLPVNQYESFEDGRNGVTVTFKRSLIGEFLDGVDNWVEQINTAVNNALSTNATETERARHIRLTTEIHRLTRYATSVKSITVNEERNGEIIPYVEEDPAEIITLLADLSSDRIFVREFEDAIYKYNEYNRMAVFGYMGRPCPSCAAKEGEEEGVFRGLVGLSPDKVFFDLSRSVYEIQKLYRDRFASIG